MCLHLVNPCIQNLDYFEELVGKDNAESVALMTTKWRERPTATEKDTSVQLLREKELKTEYWSDLLEVGAKYFKHNGNYDSATHIVRSLLQKPVLLKRKPGYAKEVLTELRKQKDARALRDEKLAKMKLDETKMAEEKTAEQKLAEARSPDESLVGEMKSQSEKQKLRQEQESGSGEGKNWFKPWKSDWWMWGLGCFVIVVCMLVVSIFDKPKDSKRQDPLDAKVTAFEAKLKVSQAVASGSEIARLEKEEFKKRNARKQRRERRENTEGNFHGIEEAVVTRSAPSISLNSWKRSSSSSGV